MKIGSETNQIQMFNYINAGKNGEKNLRIVVVIVYGLLQEGFEVGKPKLFNY